LISAKELKNNEAITQQSADIKKQPTVTVAIPALNEEDHIERVISGFLNSDYSNLVEILVADGGSKDRTREIVKRISKQDSRVKLVDNPAKFQSFALNRMIEAAEGEIFLRADAHCYYQENYLENNVEVFLETGAKNVGGAQRYVASNSIQAGIALAVNSFLGNGGAKYMDETYEGYADTVFLGCFWTKDLRKIGGFNTKNVTNQDSELNLRLIENFGESVFVSPKIKSWYYPRDSYGKLFKQYFRYGRGRLLTKVLHPKISPIRGLIPFLFMFTLLAYMITDLVTSTDLFFSYVVGILGSIVIFEAFRTVLLNKKRFRDENWTGNTDIPGTLSLWWHTSFSVLVMQVGHFSGFLYQVIRKYFFKVNGW
jgi:glycosyltransferase involved in cell wall biosynthesis